MTRENLLQEFQDLILTLLSSNIKEENIKDLWRKKYLLIELELDKLSRKDLQWFEDSYKLWHKMKIETLIDSKDLDKWKNFFPLV